MPSPQPLYRERLAPTQWWWFAAIAIGASFGLVLAPIAGRPGLVLGAMAGAGVGIAILVFTSAPIEVSDGSLRAGRARIPVADLGSVEVLDAARMSRLRGPEIDPRAYLCQRGWLPVGLKVEVADPDDPTPYWLLSSHHPDLLAEAIEVQRRRG
jgi:Protein of unknown function (DUF3093)